MAKVIAEKGPEAAATMGKRVEIKHTRVMQNASGNNVTVVDYIDVLPVDDAISQAESQLATAEALVVELEADIVAYKAIRDAE
tara:strand:+ start:55 stop:303 length:249 start_codon:yes stop_codon:yes gene_type:complete